MQGQLEEKQTLEIEELEYKTGSVSELDPQDKARLELARWILGSMAVIFILSCLWLLYVPSDNAKEIFEFVKTIVPAIVTLVIGFYFRNES